MKTKTLAVLMTALSIGVSPVGIISVAAQDAPILPKKGAAQNNQSSGGATQQPDAGATSSGGAGASSGQDAQQPSGSDGNSSGASSGTSTDGSSKIRLEPLPPRIVEIVPQYKAYRFFLLADGRIVIVDPSAFTIVYIIAA
ncbi:DUF1236 domain-containing protein [Rhizobium leguminosarum]|uniref:DUF1236 domain-containing protein n=1 Tax=Rhizobium leguminosarum TaxID=384 RepID=UPI001C9781CB|nr:DUF1236 domain-containing protein [Rhizobium leguminosarum]MBY5361219.1 DUF1236 domain-containing protein [Rhizobium leguminosarum]